MAVTSADIKVIESAVVDDTGANGGLMATAEVGSSYFPDITGSERTSGIERYRKEFVKNINRDGVTDEVQDTLFSARAFIKKITPSEDYFRIMVEDTVGDLQSDADTPATYPLDEWAGVGTLDVNETAGLSEIDVVAELVDGAGDGGFDNGCTIRISDGTATEFVVVTTVGAWSAGKSSFTLATPLVNNFDRASHTITATGVIFSSTTIGHATASFGASQELAGALVRITGGTGVGQVRRISSHTVTVLSVAYPWLVTPDTDSDFEVIATYVSKVIDCGDIVGQWTDGSDVANQITDASGLYDESSETGTPLEVFPIGLTNQTWTITILAVTTTFSVVGSVTGALANGTVGVTYEATNGASFFFKLLGSGWEGSPAEGNTLVFKTIASSKGLWVRQTVPAASEAHGDVRALIGFGGDTV